MIAVLDTNILVSGLRSSLGASNALLQKAALGEFRVAISTALALEYADVLGRPGLLPGYSAQTVAAFLDSFCAVARRLRFTSAGDRFCVIRGMIWFLSVPWLQELHTL